MSGPDDVNLRGSVELTVFRGKKILAVNSRRFGGFCGVGGKVEPGELLDDAAARELAEETGCVARSMVGVAGNVLDPIPGDDPTIKWYCHGFVVDIGDQEPRPNEPGTFPFWTTVEAMTRSSLFPEWYRWWFGLLDQLGLIPCALVLLLVAGCAGTGEIREQDALHRAPKPGALVTIMGVIYVPPGTLDDYTREPLPVSRAAGLAHERVHATRQMAGGLAGAVVWANRYTFDASFRWDEERLGYEAQIAEYVRRGYHISKDPLVEAVTDPVYHNMVSRSDAERWALSLPNVY